MATLLAAPSSFSNAFALYIAESQTVKTTVDTPVTFHLTGSAPLPFHFRVLTHPDVPDICTEGYIPNPPACDHGYMEYNGTSGQVWYTPNRGFVGMDSFTFETAAEMGPWSGDVIGVVTIEVVEELDEYNDNTPDEGGSAAVASAIGDSSNNNNDDDDNDNNSSSLETAKDIVDESRESSDVRNDVFGSILSTLDYGVNSFIEACQGVWESLA